MWLRWALLVALVLASPTISGIIAFMFCWQAVDIFERRERHVCEELPCIGSRSVGIAGRLVGSASVLGDAVRREGQPAMPIFFTF